MTIQRQAELESQLSQAVKETDEMIEALTPFASTAAICNDYGWAKTVAALGSCTNLSALRKEHFLIALELCTRLHKVRATERRRGR